VASEVALIRADIVHVPDLAQDSASHDIIISTVTDVRDVAFA
jgi:hypothetical protein